MKRLLFFLLLIPSVAFADTENPLNFREADGSPDTYPYQIKVSNGSLTDNGDGTITISTGSGTPGGSDTQVQYNRSNAFSGDAGFTYNEATDTVTTGSLVTGGASSQVSGSNGGAINFDNTNEINLSVNSETFKVHLNGNTAFFSSDTGITSLVISFDNVVISRDVYSSTSWNGSNQVPTKDAIRDKIESLSSAKVYIPLDVQSAKISNDVTSAVRIDAGCVASPCGSTPYTMWRLLFNDGTNIPSQNISLWQGRMSDNWSGGALTAKIDYLMTSSDSTSTAAGQITWGVSIWAITSGDAVSMTTESYDTENSKTQGVPTVMSRDQTVSIPLTTIDSLAAGDWFMVKLRRAGNDSITGDAAVIGMAIVET